MGPERYVLPSEGRWKSYLLYGCLALLCFLFIYVSTVFISYFWNRSQIGRDIEDYREWVYGTGTRQKSPPIQIYAANEELLGEYLPERGSWITISACSELKWLREATIVAEDREFYSHRGLSYRGILRAAWRNLASFSLREGGGTLTQQLARNLFTGRERSFYRKLYETLIAFQIEGLLSKEEILCLYLNKIYMGEGRIGAEEASWFYFQKAPWKLKAAEAAMIVGLFPSPVYYSPLNNIELSLTKQKQVLAQLVEQEILSPAQAERSKKDFLKRYEIKEGEEADPGLVGLYGASRDFRFNIAPAVNEYVKNFLYESLPEDLILKGGMRVHTSIEPRRQLLALKVVRSQIFSLRQKMLQKNPRADPEKLRKWARRLNGSFIALDAMSARILAVVGGYSITEGSMTQRVWSMLRQPGSSIKGFLYANAIHEEKLHLYSTVVDEPFALGGYKPRNWNHKYLGEVPLSQAMAMSINTIAVRTLHEMGVSVFRERLAEVLGLSVFEKQERFPSNLSLALGSGELSPLELARIYAPIINGGYSVQPYLVTRIEDSAGQILWKRGKKDSLSGPILSPEACASALKLMEYVFDPELEGTAKFIGKRRRQNPKYLPFPIAGKTGTVQIPESHKGRYRGVQGVRDAWFIGIVPGELAVLWFGQDEGAPIPASGSHAAASWASYAQGALGKREGESSFPDIDDLLETAPSPEENEENGEKEEGEEGESEDAPEQGREENTKEILEAQDKERENFREEQGERQEVETENRKQERNPLKEKAELESAPKSEEQKKEKSPQTEPPETRNETESIEN